jgi:hypothetical protein
MTRISRSEMVWVRADSSVSSIYRAALKAGTRTVTNGGELVMNYLGV